MDPDEIVLREQSDSDLASMKKPSLKCTWIYAADVKKADDIFMTKK